MTKKKELEKLNKKIQDARQKHTEILASINTDKGILSSIEDRIDVLTARYEEIDSNVEQIEKTHNKIEEKMSTVADELVQLEQKSGIEREKLNIIEKEVETAKNEFNEDIKTQKQTREKALRSVKKDFDTLTRHNLKLVMTQQNLGKNRSELEKQISSLDAEHATSKVSVAQSQDELLRLKDKISDARIDAKEYAKIARIKKRSFTKESKALTNAKEQARDKKNEIMELDKIIVSKKEEIILLDEVKFNVADREEKIGRKERYIKDMFQKAGVPFE